MSSAFGELVSLTQEKAIEMALEKNFSLQKKRLDSRIQEVLVEQAKGAFDPYFSAGYFEESVDGAGTSKQLDATVSGKLPGGTGYRLGVELNESEEGGRQPDSFAGLTVRQALLRGRVADSDQIQIEVQRLLSEAEAWALIRDMLQVVETVIVALNDLYLVERNVEIARLNRDRAEQLKTFD